MSPLLPIPRSRRPLTTALLAAAMGMLTGLAAGAASAQTVNPGDIIVERTITPRSAFDSVPKDQDPVQVRATTFPANTFNPALAQLATDADLTSAHGSSGIAPDGALTGSGMQAVTRILSGNATGSNVALNAGGMGAPAVGMGGQISSSVTGALAPLSNALAGSVGGLR